MSANANYYKFSTPNLKVRIDNVRYTFCGGTVHCFLTMEDMWGTNDAYMELACVANKLGMKYGYHTQFKASNKRAEYFVAVNSSCNKYIYVPSDYEYHGMASLKGGDIDNVEMAKRIAYQKAYRQLINFYYNCYYNLYCYVLAYSRDVWFEQMKQLEDRWIDSNNRIMGMVDPTWDGED